MIVACDARSENTFQRERWTVSVASRVQDPSSFSSICRQKHLRLTPSPGASKNRICTIFLDLFELAFFYLRTHPLDIFNHHQWQPLHFHSLLYVFIFFLLAYPDFRDAKESPISRYFNSHHRSYAWSCFKLFFCFFCDCDS